jgi:ammonium transporter, Amt family
MKATFKAALFTMAIIGTLTAIAITAPGVSADTGYEGVTAGNITWILVCTALVFIMAPGIALFYGGMLRKQSMGSIMTQSLIAMGVMTVSWILVGYSLAFSGDIGGFIGNLDHALLIGVGLESVDGAIPDMEFMMFQCVFAMVTGAIVLGACAERIRYPAITVFLAIWSVCVYAPMAHMVWGGGLLSTAGGLITTLDFAGGTVVHICAGASGLALAYFLGKRSDRIMKDRAHNVPFAFLGCAFLWLGWIGFNGGSGLAADGVAVNAVVVTMISAAFAMCTWAVIQYLHVGRVNVLGSIAGAVAGLVAITPGAGFVGPTEAIVIGIVGGLVCYFGVMFMRKKSGLDDALDVFGVHGIGGIWGALATGIFALPALTDTPGLLYGGTNLFLGQVAAVVFTLIFCFAVSYAIIWIVSKFTEVRVSEEEESIGQDIVEHGEPAYYM